MKKTSNKGFSMVELIIVIAIMAILAAALAPALIKYINKSRLSTDVQTGSTVASSINSALAVEKAYDAAPSGSGLQLNSILAAGDDFSKEVANVIGIASGATLSGKSKKDLAGSAITSQEFFCDIDPVNNKVIVYYGTVDPAHQCSPNPGASMAE